MKKIKRTIIYLMGSVFLLFILCLISFTSIKFASADSTIDKEEGKHNDELLSKSESVDVSEPKGESVQKIFENQTVNIFENLYNLDDSADYFYVEFKNGGYAVFAKQTMELMEYSVQGQLPYEQNNLKKYYAGPTNYIQKQNNKFIDIATGKKLEISDADAVAYAQNVRNFLIEEKAEKYGITEIEKFEELFNVNKKDTVVLNKKSAPNIDTKNLITASNTGTFIPNVAYFAANPSHGKNYDGGVYGNGNTGTCGPIAAQILLGYNNFYNNRNIILDKYLNGYDDNTNTVVNREYNPNYCTDPMKLTRMNTGTRSEDTGENSFYSKIISCIMKPNTAGSDNEEVKNGINKYLQENIPTSEYNVNYEEKGWFFGYKPISSSKIKSEINSGRPIIISMDVNLGGRNHFVVGYGYQDYTYPATGNTYAGYVVHYGWQGENSIWINESWCDGYISLKINHTHKYIKAAAIGSTGRMEYKCKSCGHRTDSGIYMDNIDRYIERKVSLPNIYGNNYQDYYVSFKTSGNKLFQTFGEYDLKMYLFDSDNKQLAYDDDSGFDLNALFSYTVEADTPYVLRVEAYDTENMGISKIGITPASVAYSTYESIQSIYNNEIISFNANVNTTKVFCFISQSFGYYRISTVSNDGIDGYLYLIDPESLNDCIFDDDSAGNLQALIEEYLEANKTYFLVVSNYNIAVQSGNLQLSIRKIY